MNINYDWMTRICLDDAESFQKHLCFFKVVPDIAANDFGYLAFAVHVCSVLSQLQALPKNVTLKS